LVSTDEDPVVLWVIESGTFGGVDTTGTTIRFEGDITGVDKVVDGNENIGVDSGIGVDVCVGVDACGGIDTCCVGRIGALELSKLGFLIFLIDGSDTTVVRRLKELPGRV